MAVIVETLMSEDLELGIGTTSKTHPAGGSLNGHQISISTFSIAGAAGTSNASTWDISASGVDIGGYAETSITVPGAALGDMVMVSFDSILTNALLISAHVEATNSVKVILYNPTAAKVYPASGTLNILVFKFPVGIVGGGS